MALYDYNLTDVDSTSRTTPRYVLAGWNDTDGAVLVSYYDSGTNWTLDVRTTSDPQTTAPSSDATATVVSSSTAPNFVLVGAAINGRTVYAVVGEAAAASMGVTSWTFSLWSCDLSAGTPSWTEEDSDITSGTVDTELAHEYTNSVAWDATNSELVFALPATDGSNMGQPVYDNDIWTLSSGILLFNEGLGPASVTVATNGGNSLIFGEACEIGGHTIICVAENTHNPTIGFGGFDGSTEQYSNLQALTDNPTQYSCFTDVQPTHQAAWSVISDGAGTPSFWAMSGYDDGTNQTLRVSHRQKQTTWSSNYLGNDWTEENLTDNTNLDLVASANESAFSAVGGFDSQGDLHVFVVDDTNDDIEVWKYDVGADSWDTSPTVVYSTTGANGAGYVYDAGGRTYTRTNGGTVYCGFLIEDSTQTNSVGLLEVVIEESGGQTASVTDGAKAGESLSATVDTSKTITDAAKAGETLSATVDTSKTLTDAAKAGEQLDYTSSTSKIQTDGAKAGEQLADLVANKETLLDAAKAGETLASTSATTKALTDAAKAADLLAAQWSVFESLLDGADAGETIEVTVTGATPYGKVVVSATHDIAP